MNQRPAHPVARLASVLKAWERRFGRMSQEERAAFLHNPAALALADEPFEIVDDLLEIHGPDVDAVLEEVLNTHRISVWFADWADSETDPEVEAARAEVFQFADYYRENAPVDDDWWAAATG